MMIDATPEARAFSSAAAAEIAGLLRGLPLVIVSNREPYVHKHTPQGIEVERPAGGLVAALDPVMRDLGGLWVAWGSGDADFDVTDERNCVRLPPEEPRYTLKRLRLTREEVDRFYLGYANQSLWPLFHLAVDKARFARRFWTAYESVNRRFAEAVLETVPEGALVWVQDYHLVLCPRFLREARPRLFLMQFWHIPWPAWDVFRICPQRVELLDGLLANDLLGFHLPRHVENFLDCAERVLGADVDRELGTVDYRGHRTCVHAVPISVDAESWDALARSRAAERWIQRLRHRFRLEGRRVGVGVDRLDYTKGLLERFRAIDLLFRRKPEFRERLVFVQKAAPSRTRIKAYRDLQDQVEAEISRINAFHGTADWQPIIYIPRALPAAGMAALYRMADFCLVTSLQDGMNLVAMEFVACQVDEQGVLVLSELAGASEEASMSMVINPYDPEGVVDAIQHALTMPPGERRQRMVHMRGHLARHDIRHWMLQHFRAAARLLDARTSTPPVRAHLVEILREVASRERLALLLDFDGTLTPIVDHPSEAQLPPGTRAVLARLQRHPRSLIAIVSGRALEDVRERVQLDGIVYVGNHGLEIAGPGWSQVHEAAAEARDLVATCSRRLRRRLREIEGALVEDKGLTASVHYRLTPSDHHHAVRRIVLEEVGRLPAGRVEVRHGKMVFEIRPDLDWDKGRAAVWLLEHALGPQWRARCAVICAGDDTTDEDAFVALADGGITIRVGEGRPTAARYAVADAQELAGFLDELAAWMDVDAPAAGGAGRAPAG